MAMKISMAENFMRSAKAPTIRAGVMIAKVIWKVMNTASGNNAVAEVRLDGVTPARNAFGHAADERIEVDYALFHTGGIERHAVAINDPENADQASDRETLHHHRQDVLDRTMPP